jgi:hypothetical protein
MAPKFKDILQRLSFIKDYSSLVVPAVIVVVAVVIFVLTQMMSNSLRKQVEQESISQRGKKVSSLVNNTVSREQWKHEQQYQDAYERDANQITLLAKQTTQRELLSYKIFPEPRDPSMLIFVEFGQQFQSGIKQLIAGIKAGECPTEAELSESLPSLRSQQGSKRTSRRSDEVDATIKEELCQVRAKSASIYCNPTALAGYEFWEEYRYYDVGKEESVQQCWYRQLGYWIIEDVIKTIATMNSASENVLTSPVKRLLSVDFASGGRQSSMSSRRKTASDSDRPHYVLSGVDALTEPYTRRYCNGDVDIVHFKLVVLVSVKAVLPFMTELCSAKEHEFRGFSGQGPKQTFRHNQITILGSDIRSINLEDEEHELYRYGDDAVVELDLICEYLFNKSGYEEIKPESVKKELAVEKDTERKRRGRR